MIKKIHESLIFDIKLGLYNKTVVFEKKKRVKTIDYFAFHYLCIR